MQTFLRSLPVLLTQNDANEMRQAVAIAMWPLAVGAKLKEHSKALRLIERILMIAVPDENWKREFEHHASQIVYKLNAAAGRSIVARIHCIVETEGWKGSQNRSKAKSERSATLDPKVLNAAAKIADADLRDSFIAAAAVAMKRS